MNSKNLPTIINLRRNSIMKNAKNTLSYSNFTAHVSVFETITSFFYQLYNMQCKGNFFITDANIKYKSKLVR